MSTLSLYALPRGLGICSIIAMQGSWGSVQSNGFHLVSNFLPSKFHSELQEQGKNALDNFISFYMVYTLVQNNIVPDKCLQYEINYSRQRVMRAGFIASYFIVNFLLDL